MASDSGLIIYAFNYIYPSRPLYGYLARKIIESLCLLPLKIIIAPYPPGPIAAPNFPKEP